MPARRAGTAAPGPGLPRPAGDLLNPAQLAELLDVPIGTLANWRYLGSGPPYVKVGAHVRYLRIDVDAWLAENRVTT